MLTISSLPMFTGSRKSDLVNLDTTWYHTMLIPHCYTGNCLVWCLDDIQSTHTYLRTPSTHSSMKVKDRVWRPSPHISNLSVDVWAFLQKAAGAFSRPPV